MRAHGGQRPIDDPWPGPRSLLRCRRRARELRFASQHADEEGDHQVLLLRVTHRDHQGDRRESVVGDPRDSALVIEHAVSGEEVDEQGRDAALVPVRERVILDDEVQQIRGLVLNRRVELDAPESLVERCDYAAQRFAARASPRSPPKRLSSGKRRRMSSISDRSELFEPTLVDRNALEHVALENVVRPAPEVHSFG